MQTSYIFLLKGGTGQLIGLTALESMSFLVSALMHDIGHPGQNNAYQINSISKYALRYNGKLL